MNIGINIGKITNNMKATELRIGNVISYVGNDRPLIVKGIYPTTDTNILHVQFREMNVFGSEFQHYRVNRFKGIPITEEWVLKFGFKKEKGEKYIIENDFTEYVFQFREDLPLEIVSCGFMGVKFRKEMIPSYTPEGEETTFEQHDSETYFAWSIKYVHQLQNLYFTLVGEELTVE